MGIVGKRPLSVTIISCVYILTGSVGLVYHLRETALRHEWGYGIALICVVELVAITAGAFMLRGENWARWLALAWITFHLGISFLNGWEKVVIHSCFLLVIAFFLLRKPAAEYFRATAANA